MTVTDKQNSTVLDIEVGIIDCGIANITSISQTLKRLVQRVRRISHPEDLINSNFLVLPGVGTFSEAMSRLKENNLDMAIKEFSTDRKNHILGICLGMQLLMSEGHENHSTKGLNLIEGQVRRLKETTRHQIPHIGWNSIEITETHTLFNDIPDQSDFYFAHSYVVDCVDSSVIKATTEHSENFASVIAKVNVYGVQFHPEKSSKNGLQFLSNYCKIAACSKTE
jgi:glutamine amidotransferase